EAAEAAISSPLLEDVDLAGARGILVNITAGMDISIDEFETVGNAVKAFASENATVVVGAVIDPEMTDELRVTVVATGIGQQKPEISIVPPLYKPEPMVVNASYAPSPEPEVTSNTYAEEKPQQSVATETDYLDIPAFLRKQAD
ncbi:MAG: cell division protein FtsZ, partial [Thalassotalea sp.]|nr:cell division protein FtsZ [Thalassotalea sp.]